MVTKKNAPEFEKYMRMILGCKNYKGLPYKRKRNGEISWVATAGSKLGKKRQEWIDKKAKKLGITGPGKNAKVAFKIHPTKEKNCQVCGKKMSLRYIYPNSNFVKFLVNKYGYIFHKYDSIYNVVEYLEKNKIQSKEVKAILVKHAKLELSDSEIEGSKIDEIIDLIEVKCRDSNLKMLGPGAMSDWPDRFDGYHSYNRCCRKKEDKGRSDENLRSYSKDRRAYEYWSDGNIVAANKFMSSKYFSGASADHIGPISLGFVHDPHFLQKMSGADNSSKRDRLEMNDYKLIKKKEKECNITPISWFALDIWKEMKNEVGNDDDLKVYRKKLKKNMNAFIECLWLIVKKTDNDKGRSFLIRTLIEPKKDFFKYNYKFNSNKGDYTKVPKKKSKQLDKEYERFLRVSFQSLEDYHNKNNRNIKLILTEQEKSNLISLCQAINISASDLEVFKQLKKINKEIQQRLLNE